MGEERLPVKLTLTVPRITEAGKKVVKATFAIDVDGRQESYLASELTSEMVKSEAARVANIEDPQKRTNEMYCCMMACLKMAADCQGLATDVVRIADELHTLERQLEAMQHILVRQIERQDEGKEGA